MKKSDCTPEEWEAHKAYHREWYQQNREKELARRREYNQRDDVRERRRAYDNTPEKIAARKAYNAEYGKERSKRVWAEIKDNPELKAERNAKIREYRTGMSPAMFDRIITLQGNACAICRKPFTGGRTGERKATNLGYPCADHCHDGGGPRGILCARCNHVEGGIRMSGLSVREYCDRLHDYLSNPPSKLAVLLD